MIALLAMLFRRRNRSWRSVPVSDKWNESQEWDERTGSWVRRGWVAERQALVDAAVEEYRTGKSSGTCLACSLPTGDHPMPERMWRSGPDLCAVARSKQ